MAIEFGFELYRETTSTARYELVRRSTGFSTAPFKEDEPGRSLLDEGLLQCGDIYWESYAAWSHKSRIYLTVQMYAGLDRKNRTVARRLYSHFEQGCSLANSLRDLIEELVKIEFDGGLQELTPKRDSAERYNVEFAPPQSRLRLDVPDRQEARRIAAEIAARLSGEANKILLIFVERDCAEASGLKHFAHVDSKLLSAGEPKEPSREAVTKQQEEMVRRGVENQISLPVPRSNSSFTPPSVAEEIAKGSSKVGFLLRRRASVNAGRNSLFKIFSATPREGPQGKASVEMDRINDLLRSPLSTDNQDLAIQLQSLRLLWLKWQECEAAGDGKRFNDALDSALVGEDSSKEVAALISFIRIVVGWSDDPDTRESLRSFSKWVLEYILAIEIPEALKRP